MPATLDMDAAREIQRERIRAERAERWPDLDARWFRAAETGDTAGQAAIAAAKQTLRDAPGDARIDAAQTPAALAALSLDALLP